MTTKGPERANTAMAEKEVNHQENKLDEPMLIEIGKEASYEPTLPQQPYVELRSEPSQKSGGSVMRSRAKA